MFERPRHRQIEQVLRALESSTLREHGCYFGGGTAIVLLRGEYRESVGIDFLTSDLAGFRSLRRLLGSGDGDLAPLFKVPGLVGQIGSLRADQYGIRTRLTVGDSPIKFEIIFEARIDLDTPGEDEQLCTIPTLTLRDLAASKLLANTDRYADDGVFNRDLIDLAMLECPAPILRSAVAKAERAYGDAIRRDLERSIDRLGSRDGWLERCVEALSFRWPVALLWERIRGLQRNAHS
ncbi:MAG: nucleotidyl transferase AbiEii/AbiGii toxin family protein [Pseudomonadota bacterium]